VSEPNPTSTWTVRPEPTPGEGPRDPGDDFFCLRFRVWYPSYDCAFRTRFRTSAGCADCPQGRFNLRRHEAAVRLERWTGPSEP
jgi:hypothetical protein